MCLSELLDEMRRLGVAVTESQIRWAIKSGKVTRPRVDGSFRFDFRTENVAELAEHFSSREAAHV